MSSLARIATSPESALLLAVASIAPSRERGERIRTLAAGVQDWDALLVLAHDHRMIPLLHVALCRYAADRVPAATLAELRARFVDNAARSLVFVRELHDVMQLLDGAGIRAIPYKGPILAQSLYGNVALRQMKDLDILVRPADVARTVALLLPRGYRLLDPLRRLDVALGLDNQCRLWCPEDDRMIELHWTVMPRHMALATAVDDLWPRCVEVTVLHRATRCPSHEDMLAILCLHGSKHRWERLEWICGVAQLLWSKPVDWLAVFDRAEEWHGGRMLRVGLLLAHDLLDAEMPSSVLALSRSDARAASLASDAATALFRPRGASPAAGLDSFQLQLQERISDKVRYAILRRVVRAKGRAERFARLVGGEAPA